MYCSRESLKELNIYNLKFEEMINISYIFVKCFLLRKLNVLCFKITFRNNMYCMFSQCNNEFKAKNKNHIKTIKRYPLLKRLNIFIRLIALILYF